jgi:hypothetical protein
MAQRLYHTNRGDYPHNIDGHARKHERITPGFPLNGCEKQCGDQVSGLRIARRSSLAAKGIANQATSPFLQQSTPLPQLPASILPPPGRAIYGYESSRNSAHYLSKASYGRSFVFKHLEHGVQLGDLQQILDALAQAKQF